MTLRCLLLLIIFSVSVTSCGGPHTLPTPTATTAPVAALAVTETGDLDRNEIVTSDGRTDERSIYILCKER